jgi:hypothetical protein
MSKFATAFQETTIYLYICHMWQVQLHYAFPVPPYLFVIKTLIKLRGLVRQRTIPTERPPLVDEVSANFNG